MCRFGPNRNKNFFPATMELQFRYRSVGSYFSLISHSLYTLIGLISKMLSSNIGLIWNTFCSIIAKSEILFVVFLPNLKYFCTFWFRQSLRDFWLFPPPPKKKIVCPNIKTQILTPNVFKDENNYAPRYVPRLVVQMTKRISICFSCSFFGIAHSLVCDHW